MTLTALNLSDIKRRKALSIPFLHHRNFSSTSRLSHMLLKHT